MATFSITVEQGREGVYAGQLYDNTGAAIVNIAAGSHVRVKIGRRTGTVPEIDITSSATAGGSVTTLNLTTGAYTLTIGATDSASLQEGPHDADILLIDAGDSNNPKRASLGVVNVQPAMAGAVT